MLAIGFVVLALVGAVAALRSGGGHPSTVRAAKASSPGAVQATGGTHARKVGTLSGARPSHTGGQAGTKSAGATGTLGSSSNRAATKAGAGGTGASAASHGAVAVAEVRDPEEAKSFPLPASVHHRSASSPSVAGEAAVAPGAASDAQIRKELGEEQHAEAQARAAQQRVLTPVAGGFSVGGNGTIPIPSGVPEAVQRVIAGGNAIADFPYIWGGGHASFIANGYDCSGSVSYALAAGGLLSAPLVSGDLANWGEPGPGRWITIYANAGHTFMDVDGMWFDTAGRSGPYASRWLVSTPSLSGYAVRHPPGL
jgi:cell wall-associated NlpC family hydrolase